MRFSPLFFGLLVGLTPVCAQTAPVAPAPATSNFGGLLASPVVVRREKLSLEALRSRGQIAEITLRDAAGTLTTSTLAAIGPEYALLMGERGQELKPLKELRALYNGEATMPPGQSAALWIENPLQVVPITSMGEGAEVVASFTLKNRGTAPLDVSVASTSCGCTAAKLGKVIWRRAKAPN